MTPSPRYFLYIRKSTNDDTHQVVSLDSQAFELRQLARREQLGIIEVFEESQSAKMPGRPVFNEMLDRIERGEANAVLTWEIDRLCRNPIDEGRIRWLLQRGVISEIRTASRRYAPQDAGVLMAIEGGRAADHIVKMSYHLKRTIDEKLRNGKFPGSHRPFGYAFSKELRNIVPDPVAGPIMRKLFADVADQELSLRAASLRLAEYGRKSTRGNPMSISSVQKLLSNKAYIGVFRWKGEFFEGKYTPLITPELFNKVQIVLKKRSKPRKIKHRHDFPFCGLLRCSCGASITAQFGRGHGGVYRYYRCTRKVRHCTERYAQEHLVAKQVFERLAPLAITSPEAKNLLSLIQTEEEKESETISASIKAISGELVQIQEKLDRLTRAYLDPEQLVDGDSFHTVKQELVLQKNSLKAEKERLQRKRLNAWIEPTRNLILTLETLGNMAAAASPHEIAKLLKKIGSNPTLANKTVNFSFGEDYDFLPSLLASARAAANNVAPKRRGDLPQNSQCAEWCAVEVSNL